MYNKLIKYVKMSHLLLDAIVESLNQYDLIDIQESDVNILIISTKNKNNNIQIDYRRSINSIWISSIFYGAYQFHYINNQWIDKNFNTLFNILVQILTQEITNFQHQDFIDNINKHIKQNIK